MLRWIASLACAAALAACSNVPPIHATAADHQWNGGVWNSVLGYVGPANAMVAGGPSGT